jgi:hypothetical protein
VDDCAESVNCITTFGDRVALIEGRIRFSRDGWLTDHEAAWVIVAKEGLAWRYRPAVGRANAIAYTRSLDALDGYDGVGAVPLDG